MQEQAVIDHIVRWLNDYAADAGVEGFVVGVSGGVDSAVTSALAARTEYPLLCVEMPIHQSRDQVTRAQRHIAWMKDRYANVGSEWVELTGVFDSFIDALPEAPDAPTREMSLVNTRARLRMTTLYYFAGLMNRLVVGTGNKVEDFGVGFFTKYGDGGVDLSPIADLTKTEVYALAESLGILDAIRDAPPTDGLWGDDRTDEDQIGASYPELEWAMSFDSEEGELTDRQREVLAIYRRLHAANRHKMVPIPVCEVPAALRGQA